MDNDALLNQLTTLFEKQKELSKSARGRKGQKPSNKPSRADLELQFNPYQAAAKPKELKMVRQTVIGYSYPPCTAPLADLKPIAIDELELETVHRGRVLVARTFGHPLRVQAVQNAIEDSTGGVDRLAVYNFEEELQPEQVLPKDQLLAIKEPYYKVTADGGHNVRVDHPSDLIWLHPEHHLVSAELQPKLMELATDPTQWKEKGNAAFKAKDYRSAVRLYSQGLEACNEQEGADQVRGDLHRNRAQANIYLKRYETALSDAQAAIIPKVALDRDRPVHLKSNVKALYRAGTAAYHMQDYELAQEMFQAILKDSPADMDAAWELEQTEKRIAQKTKGEYNFEKMTDSAMLIDKRINAASFTDNVVVQNTSDRGNGLFASRDIKAGDLVLVEKALCVAFNTDEGGDQSVIMNMNTSIMSVGTHPSRLVGVVHKMLHSPRLAQQFMGLYDGGYSPRGVNIVDGVVAVDAFQIEAALDFNGFGCPSVPTSVTREKEDAGTSSTGVWLTSSFINHDCVGNAVRSFIGDIMVIRASKDLKKGDEITMRYKNADDDNAEFQKTLQRSWKFKCSCALCAAEGKTPEPQRQHRLKLIKEARDFLEVNGINEKCPPSPSLIAKAEQLRVKIDKSYDESLFGDLPRQGLHDLDLWICMAHVLRSQNQVPKAAMAVLKDLGFKVTIKKKKVSIDRTHCRMDMAGIHAGMYLAMSYYRQGQKEVGDQLAQFTRGMYETIHGSMLFFEDNFGKLLG